MALEGFRTACNKPFSWGNVAAYLLGLGLHQNDEETMVPFDLSIIEAVLKKMRTLSQEKEKRDKILDSIERYRNLVSSNNYGNALVDLFNDDSAIEKAIELFDDSRSTTTIVCKSFLSYSESEASISDGERSLCFDFIKVIEEIINTPESGDARNVMRRLNEVQEDIDDAADSMRKALSGDEDAEKLIVASIASNQLGPDAVVAQVKFAPRLTPFQKLIGAFADLFCGEDNFSLDSEVFEIFPDVVPSLFCLSISAGAHKFSKKLGELADNQDYCWIAKTMEERPHAAFQTAVRQEPSNTDRHALLSLAFAEKSYQEHEFEEAKNAFASINDRLNPLASLHYETSGLMSRILNNEKVTAVEARRYLRDMPQWVSDDEVERFCNPISILLASITRGERDELLAGLPVRAMSGLELGIAAANLIESEDEESIRKIRDFAYDRLASGIFIDATKRLLNSSKIAAEGARQFFKDHPDAQLIDPLVFDFYLTEINPKTATSIIEQPSIRWVNDVEYHLVAAKHISKRDEALARVHLDKAIEIMETTDEVDCSNVGEWAAYLVDGKREDELRAILNKLAGKNVPELPLQGIVVPILALPAMRETLELAIGLLEKSSRRLFSSNLIVAQYWWNHHDYEKAREYALNSFGQLERDESALIAAEASLILFETIPENVGRYVASSKTPTMQIISSRAARARGDFKKAASCLQCAVLCSGEGQSSATSEFLVCELGGDAEPEPTIVAGGVAVTVARDDGTEETFSFHEDPDSLPSERTTFINGLHLSTFSNEFVALKGKKVGDQAKISGVSYGIKRLETLRGSMVKACMTTVDSLPGFKTISIEDTGIEKFLNDTRDMMLADQRPAFFREGFSVNGIRLHIGIDLAAELFQKSVVELAFTMFGPPAGNFYIPSFADDIPLEKDCVAVLSPSTLLILSCLDIPEKVSEALFSMCLVSGQQRSRLREEALAFLDDIRRPGGKLLPTQDGKMTLWKADDQYLTVQQDRVAKFCETIDRFQSFSNDGKVCTSVPLAELLNPVICADINYAVSQKFVYATEDEALNLLLIGENICSCNITQLLKSCGADPGTIEGIAEQLRALGATRECWADRGGHFEAVE